MSLFNFLKKKKEIEVQNSISLIEHGALIIKNPYPFQITKQMMFVNQSGLMYFPRRGKFKGYMRDNRNWGRKHKAS
jgi:hypothetical protein